MEFIRRLDTSPSTDIGNGPSPNVRLPMSVPNVRRGLDEPMSVEGLVSSLHKVQLLAGTVGVQCVNLAILDYFQTTTVYAYGGIKT